MRTLSLLLALSLALPSLAFGQSAGPSSAPGAPALSATPAPTAPLAQSAVPLALDQALALALARNEGLAQAGYAVDSADAAMLGAHARWEPQLSAGFSGRTADTISNVEGVAVDTTAAGVAGQVGVGGQAPSGTSWEVGVEMGWDQTTYKFGELEEGLDTHSVGLSLGLRQDLLAPLRYDSNRSQLRQAHEQRDRADLVAAQTAQAVWVQVAGQWWSWQRAVDEAAVAEAGLRAAQALEAQTRARAEEGQIAELEVARVTSDRLAAERLLRLQEAAVSREADRLLVLLGATPGTPIVPAGEGQLPAGFVLPSDVEAAVERALEQNLTLALARHDRQAARGLESDARAVGLPSLDLDLRLALSGLDQESAGGAWSALGDPDQALPSMSGGITFSVPLGGRQGRSERQRSAALSATRESQLQDSERQVAADTRAAWESLEAAQAGERLAEAQLAAAQLAEDGELARVEEGLRRLDQLLVARNQRLDAEVALLSARDDAARAELALVQLLGEVL